MEKIKLDIMRHKANKLSNISKILINFYKKLLY